MPESKTDDFILTGNGVSSSGVTVRLARSQEEIEAAQALRYKVFYEEQGAVPSEEMARLGRDLNAFDDIADHLIVIDESKNTLEEAVIGNYRVLRQDVAQKHGRFYTEDEFDISCLKSLDGHIMELGRSCVAADYRTRPVLQLLWQGLAEYMFHYDVDYFFGCASIGGTDVAANKELLSYLYHYHLAPPALRPRALDSVYVEMNMIPKEEINAKKAFMALPPLFKGYLRVGSFVGEGAFVDHQWKSIDVCIVLKTSLVADRYLKHYGRKSQAKTEYAG